MRYKLACLLALLPADIFAWLSPTSVELIWVKVFSYVQNFMTTLWLAFLSRWVWMQSKYLISVRSCCWLFNPQLPDSWSWGGATAVRVRVALLQLTLQQFNSLVVIVLAAVVVALAVLTIVSWANPLANSGLAYTINCFIYTFLFSVCVCVCECWALFMVYTIGRLATRVACSTNTNLQIHLMSAPQQRRHTQGISAITSVW